VPAGAEPLRRRRVGHLHGPHEQRRELRRLRHELHAAQPAERERAGVHRERLRRRELRDELLELRHERGQRLRGEHPDRRGALRRLWPRLRGPAERDGGVPRRHLRLHLHGGILGL